MSNVVLSLGGVTFRDMEVPEKISFGGKQRLTVQKLIGGGQVVQALGLDDGLISFSGIFSGADAVTRAQMLDTARALGASLPLVWDGFFYRVVIGQFSAEYKKPNLIPFTISCVVVEDPLAALAQNVAPVANLVEGDLFAAMAMSGLAGVSLTGLSAASLAGFATVKSTLESKIEGTGQQVTSLAAQLNGAVTPEAGIGALGGLARAAGQLAGMSSMRGYINRAAANLGGALA